MKIQGSDHRIGEIARLEPSAPAQKHPAGTQGPRKSDEVDISSRAREAGRIMEAVKRVPDVREERVLQVREAIEAGTYRVKGSDVAEKLIKDSMLGSII